MCGILWCPSGSRPRRCWGTLTLRYSRERSECPAVLGSTTYDTRITASRPVSLAATENEDTVSRTGTSVVELTWSS